MKNPIVNFLLFFTLFLIVNQGFAQLVTGIEQGNTFPEICLSNNLGKNICLSSLKGKMVFVNFRNNAKAKFPFSRCYTVFSNKEFKEGLGFIIVDVTFEKSPNFDYRAKNDSIDAFYQFNDATELESDVLRNLGITQLPANFLLNKDGLIIAKNLSATALYDTLGNLFTANPPHTRYGKVLTNDYHKVNDSIYDVKVYYDSLWQITSQQSAQYYCVSQWNSLTSTFYGKFTTYTISGKKYDDGKFVTNNYKNLLDGTYGSFWENGNLKMVGRYKNDLLSGGLQFFNENSESLLSVFCANDNFKFVSTLESDKDTSLIKKGFVWSWIIESYDKSNNMQLTGSLINFKRDKQWTILNHGDTVLFENYDNNNFLDGFAFDNGKKVQTSSPTIGAWIFTPYSLKRRKAFILNPEFSKIPYTGYSRIYSKNSKIGLADEMPEFPGGEIALRKFISMNTVYPPEARELDIKGRVYVKFRISTLGYVDGISIAKSVHPLLDDEAMRVVGTLPNFKPGKQNGVAVNVWYTVPVNFDLQ